MTVRTFIDTNILVYADDRDAGAKRRTAQEVIGAAIEAGQAVVSTQVLQEYFSIATRKLGLSAEAARSRVAALATLDVVRMEPEMILAAIDLHRLRPISFWDALIVRAAIASGCVRLLSEDLTHQDSYESVQVENPFASRAGR